MGTTSDVEENERQWSWAFELMQMVGKSHILGISFGNEVDHKDMDWPGMTSWVPSLVKKMDGANLKDIPLTIVWTFGIVNKLEKGPIADFLRAMQTQYEDRWVWATNIYPIWDTSMYPDQKKGNCA